MSDAGAHRDSRVSDADVADACTGGRGDESRSIRSDPAQHVGALLGNFRLLEAAGACGVIAARLTADDAPTKPPEWWEALADSARTYRSAIYATGVQGFSGIDEWSHSGNAGSGSDADLVRERKRLGAEHRKWLCEVPGGHAYVAWLSAYIAVAEIDGNRALASLDTCAAIMQEFVDAPELEREPSLYDFLQGAADALALFLRLPEHPLRDMRRFAFLPFSLPTG
jgi:hypothetical protein